MAAEWYVKRNDRKLGPFSSRDLKRLASAGKLTEEDLIWKDSLSEWIPATRVESLFGDNSELSLTAPGAANEAGTLGRRASESTEAAPDSDEEPFESSDDDNLPPLPGPRKASSVSPRAHRLFGSTDRMCWWLQFYARVNFGFSLFVCVPLFAFGLLMVILSLANIIDQAGRANETAASGGFLAGATLVSSLAYIVCSLLWFMLMNVFTLACFWAAEVLLLLKERR